MEATHEFLAPFSTLGDFFAAVYHQSTPAWGVDSSSLYGNILRNAPGGTPGCASYGADGSDTDIHSVVFAFRVPSGLTDPSTGILISSFICRGHIILMAFIIGAIQRESKTFVNPLIAVTSNGALNESIPSSYSIATITPSSAAFLSAAKSGTFEPNATILRVVNPSNKPVPSPPISYLKIALLVHADFQVVVTLQVDSHLVPTSSMRYVTALEAPLDDSSKKFMGSVNATFAVTSIALS